MKTVIGSARNLLALVGNDDTSKAAAMAEVVLIVSEPTYRADATGTMVKVRDTESIRFVCTTGVLRDLAKEFAAWANELDEVFRFDDETPDAEAAPAASAANTTNP